MREQLLSSLIIGVSALMALSCLGWWLGRAPRFSLEQRVPEPPPSGKQMQVVDIEGRFQQFDGQPADIPGTWPNFRGPAHDNHAKQATGLNTAWPAAGPPVLWSLPLGDGHAAPAVHNGRVYVLDYDEQEHADALRCLSLADGREIWRRSYQVRIKRNHGISRTIPAVSDDYVVSMGPKCHVLCVDADDGGFRWGLDLARDFGTTVPLWYTGQCPFIDDGIAVLAPAGSQALLMGVDCATGEIAWQTPNPNAWQMSHSSVIPTTIAGRRLYLYCAIGGLVAVSAEPEDRGAPLWEFKDWNHAVVSPSPLPLGDGRILLTAGYGVGSRMLRVTVDAAGQWQVETLYKLDKETFSCEQQTPVFYRGHLYGVLANDAGGHRRQLACLHPDGRVMWTSGKDERFGLGPFLVADGKLFVLDDDGTLTVARADPAGYARLARSQVLHGRDAWGPMALVAGRLLLRDSEQLLCLDLRTL
jgi:outer membrane protein assembly factor BamB